jgi:hypothetical protein
MRHNSVWRGTGDAGKAGELLDVFNTRTTAIARVAETDFNLALIY